MGRISRIGSITHARRRWTSSDRAARHALHRSSWPRRRCRGRGRDRRPDRRTRPRPDVLAGQFILRPTDAGLVLDLQFPQVFRRRWPPPAGSVARDRPRRLRRETHRPASAAVQRHRHRRRWHLGRVHRRDLQPGLHGTAVAPTLTASLSGETGPLGHPSSPWGLNARAGDSNLQASTVTLPRGIAADPANIQNACPEAVFRPPAVARRPRAWAPRPHASRSPPNRSRATSTSSSSRASSSPASDSASRAATRSACSPACASVRRAGIVVQFGGDPGSPAATPGPHDHGRVRRDRSGSPAASAWTGAFGMRPSAARVWQASSHTIPAPQPAARRQARLGDALRDAWTRRAPHRSRWTQPALTQGHVADRLIVSTRRRVREQALPHARARRRRPRPSSTTNRTVAVFPSSSTTTRLTLAMRGGTVRKSPTLWHERGRSVIVDVRIAFTDGTVHGRRSGCGRPERRCSLRNRASSAGRRRAGRRRCVRGRGARTAARAREGGNGQRIPHLVAHQRPLAGQRLERVL